MVNLFFVRFAKQQPIVVVSPMLARLINPLVHDHVHGGPPVEIPDPNRVVVAGGPGGECWGGGGGQRVAGGGGGGCV